MTRSVIVIEDDRFLSELYKDALQAAGFLVYAAFTAETAMEILSENEIDVIVLDLFLPDCGGVQILHELQSHPKAATIPVIIQSTVHPADCGLDKSAWQQYGVIEYLYKATARPRHLVRAVKTATSYETV